MRSSVIDAPDVRKAVVLDERSCCMAGADPARAGRNTMEQQQLRLAGLEQEARDRLQQMEQAEAARRAEHDEQLQTIQEELLTLRKLAAGFRNAGEQLQRFRQEMLGQMEAETARLALAAAGRMMLSEPCDSGGLARAAIREILGSTSTADLIRLRLNPADRTRLMETSAPELEADGIPIVSDSAVPRGGCIADAVFGTIDATVDTRWAEMVRMLTEAAAPSGQKPEQAALPAQPHVETEDNTNPPEPADETPAYEDQSLPQTETIATGSVDTPDSAAETREPEAALAE